MAAKYLVQIEQLGTSVPAMEGTAFLQEVELKNWRHPEDPIECDFIKLDVLKEHVLSRKYLRCLTPVGTIEFVAAGLWYRPHQAPEHPRCDFQPGLLRAPHRSELSYGRNPRLHDQMACGQRIHQVGADIKK